MAQGKDFGLEGSPAAQRASKTGKEKAEDGEHDERESLRDHGSQGQRVQSERSCGYGQVDEITHLVIWRRLSQIDG
jgi:hypothetical protein